ncbi:MAG: hypothetical protein LBR00_03580, partial [Clostridiales Family XIII bacterium]|nr:hypothetical protein [Clostridiales Family XIII bacterium]
RDDAVRRQRRQNGLVLHRLFFLFFHKAILPHMHRRPQTYALVLETVIARGTWDIGLGVARRKAQAGCTIFQVKATMRPPKAVSTAINGS